MDAVLSVFSARPAETKEVISSATRGLEAAQRKTKEGLAGLSVAVTLDVAAPRVVVPVSSSRDEGFLLLDMGHMLVQGGSSGSAGVGAMTYTAELSDMNARLPARKAQLLVRRSMDRVIEPFRVKARAAVGGGGVDDPGVVLDMEVVPGVKGVISPDKIHDLYRVLDYVSKAAFLGPAAASGATLAGGGTGVERMGGGGELVVVDERSAGGMPGQRESLVLWQWRLKVPTIAFLLVEPDKDPTNTNDGLLAAASGA